MNRFYVYRMLDTFNCVATYVNLSFNSHGSTVNSALAVESLKLFIKKLKSRLVNKFV